MTRYEFFRKLYNETHILWGHRFDVVFSYDYNSNIPSYNIKICEKDNQNNILLVIFFDYCLIKQYIMFRDDKNATLTMIEIKQYENI